MYIKMVSIALKNHGSTEDRITCAYDGKSEFILSEFTDKQSANNWVNNGYNQHGSTYIKSTMNERHMTLKFYVNYKSPYLYSGEYVYEKMMRVLSPLNGILTLRVITLAGGATEITTDTLMLRAIDVYISEPPSLVSQHGGLMEYSVELVATFPFWRDDKTSVIEFTNAVGGFTFQTQFDELLGKKFGEDGHIVTVNNKGDIPSPVTIMSTNTGMTNPKILLQDGTFIGITGEINSNDSLEITTEYGNKNVLINGFYRNALLTVGSQWIQLPVGVNTLSAFVDSGTLNIKMYYNNYYNSYTR